jgi:hypothetical protein
MSELVLTQDQQAAYQAFVGFIVDPEESVFVLEGYSGTGKTTLVNKLLTDLPSTLKMAQLVGMSDIEWEVQLTATTNKACEALAAITNAEVRTIQSVLGLRPFTDHKANPPKTTLKLHGGAEIVENLILVIDEASFVDDPLLLFIASQTMNCKIMFIGDPAQLTLGGNRAPVFEKGYMTARLSQVVRQAEGNPIIDLATAFRDTVNGNGWIQFTPDQVNIKHLTRDEFGAAIRDEFTRPNWQHACSKVLAWRNKTVIGYNHEIRNLVQGVPELQAGDYAVCNSYVQTQGGSVKTDQTVQITHITPTTKQGVQGWSVTLDGNYKKVAFLPESLEAKKKTIKQARKEENYTLLDEIENRWIDLRAAYACTVNKSQGSTYDRVYIDLDDISACRSGNNMARMMYVAVSRARHQVILTGDLV